MKSRDEEPDEFYISHSAAWFGTNTYSMTLPIVRSPRNIDRESRMLSQYFTDSHVLQHSPTSHASPKPEPTNSDACSEWYRDWLVN
jgi:hypothetical protein